MGGAAAAAGRRIGVGDDCATNPAGTGSLAAVVVVAAAWWGGLAACWWETRE